MNLKIEGRLLLAGSSNYAVDIIIYTRTHCIAFPCKKSTTSLRLVRKTQKVRSVAPNHRTSLALSLLDSTTVEAMLS